MGVVLLIARLFLALIFGVAGLAKAADPAGSREALISFGVPERLAPLMARALAFAEIIIALALIPLNFAWWGAVAALALLMIFAAVIGANLARGQSPDCRCFGQLYSEPVSWTTFARNLTLAAIAGLVVIQGRNNPGLSAVKWLTDMRAMELINLVIGVSVIGLLAAISIFLSRMLKQQAELLGSMQAIKAALNEDGEPAPAEPKEAALPTEGLPVGANAPKFSLATIAGEKMSLDDLLKDGKSVLLLFAGPNCWGCKILLPMVRAWESDYSDRLTIAVLSNGSIEDNRNRMVKYEIGLLLLDADSAVADDYQAKWTPAAVLIHPDGRIASQNTYGDNAIREMVRDLIASDQAQTGSPNGNGAKPLIPQVALRHSVRKIGEPAPRFSLPDLSGKMIDAEQLLGSPSLLIFWHPHCEFCQAMFDDLKDWEESPPSGAPKLVLIASGEPDAIRALNKDLKSLTLLDPSFEIGPLVGTKYTPSAILIDGEGRIASSLAMGDHNVRALVGLPKAEALV